MPKFKNNKTGKVIEENLIYYVNKYRNNPNFTEIKETPKTEKSVKGKENKEKKEEVENTPQ